MPLYIRIKTRGTESDFRGLQLEHGLDFDVNNPRDPGHWLATVRDRSRLEPWVAFPDEAVDRMRAAMARLRSGDESPPRELGKFAQYYGGEQGLVDQYLGGGQVVHAPRG